MCLEQLRAVNGYAAGEFGWFDGNGNPQDGVLLQHIYTIPTSFLPGKNYMIVAIILFFQGLFSSARSAAWR